MALESLLILALRERTHKQEKDTLQTTKAADHIVYQLNFK
jgi:hypothetical protein